MLTLELRYQWVIGTALILNRKDRQALARAKIVATMTEGQISSASCRSSGTQYPAARTFEDGFL